MWTMKDKGSGDNDIQSILFKEYLDSVIEGIRGANYVLSGLAITGGADMTPAISKGAVISNGIMYAIAAADVTIGTADTTHPRIDLVVVNSSGALAVRAGTAAANPAPPARTTNDVLLWAVYVPANDTAIATSQCTDLRMVRDSGVCLYRTTTAETTNTTASAIHILNKTGSGVVIPNGLFLAGKILRVTINCNVLINSGTPTLTLAIAYGGTTLFADTSAAAAADADRRPFRICFDLVAQGNADQNLTGNLFNADFSTGITAPTTGYGDAFPVAASQEATPAFGGAAAVDSDAADRTLTVTWTFSVSNSANEMVVESAMVELI